jgi:hypothetical protein
MLGESTRVHVEEFEGNLNGVLWVSLEAAWNLHETNGNRWQIYGDSLARGLAQADVHLYNFSKSSISLHTALCSAYALLYFFVCTYDITVNININKSIFTCKFSTVICGAQHKACTHYTAVAAANVFK